MCKWQVLERLLKPLRILLGVKGYAENLPDGRVRIVCEGEEKNILKMDDSLKEKQPPFARVDHTEIEFAPYSGEFSSFERNGHDVIEENENTTSLLKSMVNYMKIFVDKSEVVNTCLGEIKVSADDMHVTLKSVKEDTAQIPRIVENTERILEHTSYIPAMREDTSEIKSNTREIVDKLQSKYEERSKEIAQMKITLTKIETKVFS